MKRTAILGASSWIGHHLISALQSFGPHINILGSFYSNTPSHLTHRYRASSEELSVHVDALSNFAPGHVFNLLRGEGDIEFALHQWLIDFCTKTDTHYSYASSFNAVDGDLGRPHVESDLPNAQSAYGRFKGRCENALFESQASHSIFRFSAVQGWAPFRIARTEQFLQRLSRGESIEVPRGVIQNRLAVQTLAAMMGAIAIGKGQGVFNLGATDHSDEIEYSRRLAVAFGYSKDMIIETGENPCNAVMVPKNVFNYDQGRSACTEDEGITKVADEKHFQKYRFGPARSGEGLGVRGLPK